MKIVAALIILSILLCAIPLKVQNDGSSKSFTVGPSYELSAGIQNTNCTRIGLPYLYEYNGWPFKTYVSNDECHRDGGNEAYPTGVILNVLCATGALVAVLMASKLIRKRF